MYDVYGIGNALVDMEYGVEPSELSHVGLDKGVMTLVDVDRQSGMMARFSDREVNRSAGGSAANTVIALSQFGGSGFYSCKIGDDDLGALYRDDLKANGVDTNARSGGDPGYTGRCLVFVTPDADRTMATYLGTSSGLGRGEVDITALRSSRFLYIEGYLAASEKARDAVAYARQVARDHGVRTAISLSDPAIVENFRDGLLEMIGPGADLLFGNEDEALAITGASDLDGALERLQAFAREFVVTRGPRPAIAWTGSERVEIPAHPVEPLDTVGAGDMFAGAYLYGRSRGWSHEGSARLAAAACAYLIRSYGPRVRGDEAQRILTDFEGGRGAVSATA